MTVSVVMLMSAGREAMQCRALRSIKEQTYPNIEVVAFDTSHLRGKTIGYMHNVANAIATGSILAHADDDDLSHPRRIEEQVALLQASGKQCVGYNELLFWDTRQSQSEAWLYRNSNPSWLAGASMCMWRSAWEACPFDHAPHEDQRWWAKNAAQCEGISSLTFDTPRGIADPMIICQMHAGGTEQIPRKVMESGGGGVWRRAPEWDAHCAERMRL